jgi:hypothetical protein
VQDDPNQPVGWRLFSAPGRPADNETLATACERLLCNPAIERAIFPR